ncbi:uncharacterized protein [Haliotis asinina]|uniref:uncharacterized protein n=1 Tax=Haliotis asinina TaxID=109174 RepID=UPI00353184E7
MFSTLTKDEELYLLTLSTAVTFGADCSLPACIPSTDMNIDWSTCKAVSSGVGAGGAPNLYVQEGSVTRDTSCTGDQLCTTGSIDTCDFDVGGSHDMHRSGHLGDHYCRSHQLRRRNVRWHP